MYKLKMIISLYNKLVVRNEIEHERKRSKGKARRV